MEPVSPALSSPDPKASLRDLVRSVVLRTYPDVGEFEVDIERPKNPEHGDYTTNAALQLAKRVGRKPREAADYARAIRTIHAIGRQVSGFLERFDALLTPTMATPPLPLGRLSLSRGDLPGLLADLARTVGFTQLFNASGHPAMSVPLFWNGAGVPVGVQFAGRFGDEATLFRLAAQLESARPWVARRPAV